MEDLNIISEFSIYFDGKSGSGGSLVDGILGIFLCEGAVKEAPGEGFERGGAGGAGSGGVPGFTEGKSGGRSWCFLIKEFEGGGSCGGASEIGGYVHEDLGGGFGEGRFGEIVECEGSPSGGESPRVVVEKGGAGCFCKEILRWWRRWFYQICC